MASASYRLTLIAVVAAVGLASTSFAQTTSDVKPEASAKPSSPAVQDESAPAKLRSLIDALSGKWHLNVKFEPMSEMPNGLSGTGEETWHAGPGGYTLIEEERIPMPGGEGYLLGIIWWDSSSKSFKGMECNNQLPFTCDLKGALADITVTWDGKSFRLDEIETHNGKKTIWHETWSNITATSFIQTGDVTQPDGSTTHFMTVQASKETAN
jgi:hypothetical protein